MRTRERETSGNVPVLRASPPTFSMWHCTLEILDEVHQSKNPVNPLEDYWDRVKKCTAFIQSPAGAREQSSKHSEIVFIHCSLFPIGYIVWLGWSKWVAISKSPTYLQPQFQFYGWGWKKKKLGTKTWMWEIFLYLSHTELWWRCS
jgi:hypothetical protein